MKVIMSSNFKSREHDKKEPDIKINENINSIIFYIVSLVLSLAVVVLMITAFHNLSVRATDINEFSDYTVIIDAGHGGEDGGAVANDVCEKDINLSIALKLNDLFQANGIKTVMTRTEDISLADPNITTVKGRKTSDIKERAELLNSSTKNILISIHQNKFEQEQYYGTQIFYATKNSKSQLLAESIKKSVVNALQPENERETKPTDKNIYLLNTTDNIAVLVECGFLSNKAESEKLKNEEYQKELCSAIFEGFKNFTAMATN